MTPQLALLYIVRHRIESIVASHISNRDSRQLLTDQGNKLVSGYCFFFVFLAFPRLQNILVGTIIISETPADFPVILVHRDMHLLNSVLKSYSIPQFLLFLAA